MNTKLIIFFAFLPALIGISSCHSPATDRFPGADSSSKRVDTTGYAVAFNSAYRDKILLLGCMVYAENAANRLRMDSNLEFEGIATRFVVSANPDKNIDSVIDDFIQRNPKIDFRSDAAMHAISNFIDNYTIVSDVIFGKIGSDDEVGEMKAIEAKIRKVPEIDRIYNEYMAGRPDLSSLSSGEGSGMILQLGFYLSTLDLNKRNEILRQLL
ncbi:MAG: hypothetical protein Q8927_07790 [Bacteroidota bacterium]|nr:hypothetical protein [Bacteroidota bacterium]MDP4216089.1 hypothetical protein [Bacteroidota bacterium]